MDSLSLLVLADFDGTVMFAIFLFSVDVLLASFVLVISSVFFLDESEQLAQSDHHQVVPIAV